MRYLLLILFLISSVTYGQHAVEDFVIPSRANGGKVILAPKDSGGVERVLLIIDPETQTLSAPFGLSLAGQTLIADKLQADTITNEAGGGPPNFSLGILSDGSATFTGSGDGKIIIQDPAGDEWRLFESASGELYWYNQTDSRRQMTFDPTHEAVYFGLGTLAEPSIAFYQDQDTGFHSAVGNELVVVAGGNVSATFNSTGINLGEQTLDYYSYGTFNALWNPADWSVDPGTVQIEWTRIGKQVTLYVPAFSGTSSSASMGFGGTPNEIETNPTRTAYSHYVPVTNNGTNQTGCVGTASSGAYHILFRRSETCSTFTSSGTKGLLHAIYFTYKIQ
jgi:hypothetical protein